MPRRCHRGYECQVCDKRLRYETELELQEKLASWYEHSFAHAMGELKILSCPQCAKLDAQSILLCYMDRIRSGLDINYH